MELLLVLCVLSPAIIAQRYHKTGNPNDEPFLPIYPVFPYSPKLMKRGTDREIITQLSPELYAPKLDARDSYTASYSSNYPRDSYYSTYNPYPKSPSTSTYSPYYGPVPYTYTTPYTPYSAPYTPATYSGSPYSSPPYPSYYYQPPYYPPNYYPHPYPPGPPGEYSGPGPKPEPDSSDASNEKDEKDEKEEKEKTQRSKSKDSSLSNGNQFVDGGNYISSNGKDLESQSSTYKAQSPYNQLVPVPDFRNLPIPVPRTTYRVISVGGQPVGPDYPLPSHYAKVQQLEQAMSQALAKLLAQSSNQAPPDASYANYDSNRNTLTKPQDAQSYVTVPNVIAKTGLVYTGPLKGDNSQYYTANPHLRSAEQPQVIPVTSLAKASSKYPDNQYMQKSVTRMAMQEPQGVYIPPKNSKNQPSDDYGVYENQASQNYDLPQQNYPIQGQGPVSYQHQNLVSVQTPQSHSYQFNSYRPSQASQQQQQQQQYKMTNLEDVNFGAKTSKG
ncbi:adhesive plaque matrix protein-like [Orussus abietinus]|uniref:adhesive plaque matrix protein-like n=1 Tax=Orussus abietinus TaxID=222816 RepID=UPI0006257CA7|nr:adhesive plaque matrix protein-like [Orussus abietinus]